MDAVQKVFKLNNTYSDNVLYADEKAISVVESKREENPLEEDF